MAGTFTLVEFGKLAEVKKDKLLDSVARTLIQESQPMKYIPWETIGLLYRKLIRIQALPSVSRRKLNSAWTATTGTTEVLSEGLSIVGGNIDVDKELVEGNQTIEDVRALQQYMKVQALAYDFNDQFINGAVISDEDTFDGLKARCDRADMSAQKLVSATTTNLITDSQAHALDFIGEMDRLFDALDGHSPTFLVTNGVGLRKITQALRIAGVLKTDRDNFGQLVILWGDAPIYDMGVQADQSTKIMGDEAIGGGAWSSGNYYFSIYAVKIGEGTHFWGIQKHKLEVKDAGLLEDMVTYRTNVNWPVGLACVNKRSIARLYGVRHA